MSEKKEIVEEKVKDEKPRKLTAQIDIPFDLSDVPEYEISLAKRWSDDIIFDEFETQAHGLGATYPIALCDSVSSFGSSYTKNNISKTHSAQWLTTSMYKKCAFKMKNPEGEGEISVFEARNCSIEGRIPCRARLAAVYKFLSTYKPDELKKQREQYLKNKDEIDSKHLERYTLDAIVAPIEQLPFVSSKQIENIRRIIDEGKYRRYKDNKANVIGVEYYIDKKYFKKYIDIDLYYSYIKNSFYSIKDSYNLETLQYIFILQLLTQDLNLYHKYVERIKSEEPKLEEIKGNSYYGYVSGNDRDEVANAVKKKVLSLSVSFNIPSTYVHRYAMEMMQNLADVDSNLSWYRPILYRSFSYDSIYLITGLKEFVNAYNSVGTDYASPLKRQFEHFLKQMRPFTERRFILLAGTQDEIDDFLNLDQSFHLLFDKNAIKIEDKNIDELYKIYKQRVEKGLNTKLKKSDEKNFKEYLAYNRGVLPYKNSTLATYLANYSISKGSAELPSDIANMKQKDFMKQLNSLIGLNEIKKQILQLYSYAKYRKAAEEQGIKLKKSNLHMVFTGNPGTGKTITARIIARALYDIGIIKENKLIESERKDFIGKYIGHTAPKTAEMIQKARGGVLFIDEAYSLVNGYEKDFGKEALAALIKGMEDYRDDLIVIFAGYKAEMQEFIDVNPGLQSRIGYTFHFEDYTNEELFEMFLKKIEDSNLHLDKKCHKPIKEIISYFSELRNVGNGRFVEKLYQIIIQKRSENENPDLSYIDIKSIPTIKEVAKLMPQKESLITPDRISDDEVKRVAYHELGHAFIAEHFKVNDVEKIKITVSANGALGYIMCNNKNSNILKDESEYRKIICMKLAGIACEKLFFGNYANGGYDDLRESSELIKSMICDYGLSSLGISAVYYSNKNDERVYEEFNKIINEEFERAYSILEQNKERLERMSKVLIRKKVITKDEIEGFFKE